MAPPASVPKNAWALLQRTAKHFFEDHAPRLSAALAYYAIFSLAPLLLVAILAGGLVFGPEVTQEHALREVEGLMGAEGAEAVAALLEGYRSQQQARGDALAPGLGLAILLFSATGAFAQLKEALNTMWEVKPERGGAKHFVRKRAIGLAMVFGVVFLLVVSLMLGALIGALAAFVAGFMPASQVAFRAIDVLLRIAIFTGIFALLFKHVPDAKIAWKDVGLGAFATAILFTLAQAGIGLWLGQTEAFAAYGAVGSILLVLVWTYVAALVILFGAEFTQVWANRHGSEVEPEHHAVRAPHGRRPDEMKTKEEELAQEEQENGRDRDAKDGSGEGVPRRDRRGRAT